MMHGNRIWLSRLRFLLYKMWSLSLCIQVGITRSWRRWILCECELIWLYIFWGARMVCQRICLLWRITILSLILICWYLFCVIERYIVRIRSIQLLIPRCSLKQSIMWCLRCRHYPPPHRFSLCNIIIIASSCHLCVLRRLNLRCLHDLDDISFSVSLHGCMITWKIDQGHPFLLFLYLCDEFPLINLIDVNHSLWWCSL